MKFFLVLFICAFFSSCASLQVAETRNAQNVKDIGIEWNYADNVNKRYIPLTDSAIGIAINSFNSEKHSFQVHKKRRTDKDYISISFTKGKIVRPVEKAAGYFITTVGIAAIPVLIIVESPLIIGFYYIPQNALLSTIALSPSLAADKYMDRQVASATGTLFTRQKKQVPKVAVKYGDLFKKVLLDVEKQIGVHK